ncbi:MAG: acyl-CoA desaturase [bacterium]|nr:acyl-CoA desaturase [bacterium]
MAVWRWFDTEDDVVPGEGIDWLRVVPFLGLHVVCLAVLWVGWSPVAIGVAALAYAVRMFAITGFYHRYFSHRTFETSRVMQFVFAVLGSTAVQRGPLWWAAHHRNHHRHSDREEDPHSPHRHGLLWSHMLWITSRENFPTDMDVVKDLSKYPELRFLNRFDMLVPVLTAAGMYGLGVWMEGMGVQTSGWQMLVWGFFVSTIVLFHATCTINSLAHCFGSRRFETGEESRNNWLLALITFGEGWHNNHHYYPGTVRQGFYWWEVDMTYYILRVLAALGLIRDLRPVPARVYENQEPGR